MVSAPLMVTTPKIIIKIIPKIIIQIAIDTKHNNK